MANHKSAKKRILRNESKRQSNKSRLSAIRTFVKKVKTLMTNKTEGKEVQSALSKANSELAKGVKKGIVSKKKMSRTMSKMAKTAFPNPTK